MFSLQGKKALVTGASRGIGRGIALALARQGADVCVNFRSKETEAEEVVRQIKEIGSDAFAFKADVSILSDQEALFSAIDARWGKLDILVNNAGVLQFKPFEEITEEDWNNMIGVNLKGPYFCAQKALRLMGKGGKIINIASISSGGMGVAYPQISHYTTSKGGIVGMTEALAVELGPKGININAIAPGGINTDIGKDKAVDENVRKMMLARIPKGRIGEPEDIGATAAFLASSESDYITGTVIYVDGGWLTA